MGMAEGMGIATAGDKLMGLTGKLVWGGEGWGGPKAHSPPHLSCHI